MPELLSRHPAAIITPMALLVPVFGILGSVAIFGETVSPQKIAALLLIVAGLAVGLYGQRVVRYFGVQTG